VNFIFTSFSAKSPVNSKTGIPDFSLRMPISLNLKPWVISRSYRLAECLFSAKCGINAHICIFKRFAVIYFSLSINPLFGNALQIFQALP
jgi:hypothetical protein